MKEGSKRMERLTKRDGEDNKNAFCPSDVKCCGRCSVCDHMDKMMEKLADYEDEEGNGMLIHLPCRVGDTVYEIRIGEDKPFIIVEAEIVEIKQNVNGLFFVPSVPHAAYRLSDFGKIVFTTEKEAKQALKKMGE